MKTSRRWAVTFMVALAIAAPLFAAPVVALPPRAPAADRLMRNAADAVTSAGSIRYALEMRTTFTSIRGDSWFSQSTLAGSYAAPDRLDGVLTITNPWTTTRSQVVVAGGEAYVSDLQTGERQEGLKLAASYYPAILAGCLLRMAAADTDNLKFLGVEWLDDEQVYHLGGPGGARDELELEYWLGVEDGLLRKAAVRTGQRPGWSNEAHAIQLTATLRLLSGGEPPPWAGAVESTAN